MIDGYPQGSDIAIMNTIYNFPTKDESTGKMVDDFMAIVYKDNKTGKKGHQILFKPDITFYKTKDNVVVPDHPLFFIEKEKVEPVTVPYRKLERTIAQITGNEAFYEENIMNKNRAENRKLHTDPRIYFSDINIEDHYRYLFSKMYTNNITKLHKAFYDIECDTKYMAGTFVESGECPINMVSLHDEMYDKTISFILRDSRNPLIAKFEQMVVDGTFNEDTIKNFVEKAVGGRKQCIRLKCDKTKYQLLFFDNEIDLIESFFQMVHFLDPDFIEGWNSSAFDLQYFIDRIWALGYEPADIMCNKSWGVKIVKNFIDTRNINEFAERSDYAVISGNPVWMDQMIQFASRRKSKIGSFKSFKLDDIGYETAKVKKLSYAHITTNIAELPYLDFITFVLYNIMDVVVQKCIEVKTQDLEYIFSKCIVNNTVYRKGHRQTVYLINRMALEFDKLGYVIGNNINRWNEKPDKFLGALVGDPLKTNDFAKIKIGGRSIMVADNLQDYDYKSLYPSIMGEFNIAPNTQIGRIEIDHKVYENENAYHLEKYSRSGEFIDNMVADNLIEFCKRWLHLAGIMEFLEDMKEYESQFIYGAPYRQFKNIEGVLKENPIYDCKAPIKAIVVGETVPQAIYFFSNLENNGISNNFNDIISGNGLISGGGL